MAANMYRVGDYVYFENSSSNPYQIRRIEELTKTPNGNVEAKCVCFYRRRDISSSLISLADKHATALEEERDDAEFDNLAEVDRHQLKHKELFLSRQLESLPATHIRGKCSVTLLNETESLQSYLNKEDAFFYTLVYDPVQKTLLADKGEIRVGSRYQAEVPPLLKEDESDGRELAKMESKIWDPENPLEDRQIDQFMVIARSVGTFARALDCSSSVRQPSLHMSAAAASRDITLFHAMNTLHKTQYDATKAITSLVPQGGPVLCRDEMEEWSASEANLFEEALEKYGKDFNDIRQDFLPWKSLNSIIEYYYMWKTTDRYVQQKRLKAAEAESKLKQVYIPNYNKPNPNQITNKPGTPNSLMNGQGEKPTRACEGCYATNSHQWYSWGPPNMQCRLCSVCWSYWKKMGGLKMPTRLERLAGHMPMHRPFRCTIRDCGKEFKLKAHLARHCATAHGLTIRQSNSPKFTVKTRQAFFLCATPLTRLSRRLCKDILKPRHAARVPFDPVNIASIKIECQTRMPEDPQKVLKKRKRTLPDLSKILGKLGIDVKADSPEWMNGCSIPPEPVLGKPPRTIASCTDRKEYKSMFPDHPVREPKPNAERHSGGDEKPGSVPSNPTTILNNVSPPIMKKRPYDQMNGMDGPAAKRSLPMGGPNDMPMKKGDQPAVRQTAMLPGMFSNSAVPRTNQVMPLHNPHLFPGDGVGPHPLLPPGSGGPPLLTPGSGVNLLNSGSPLLMSGNGVLNAPGTRPPGVPGMTNHNGSNRQFAKTLAINRPVKRRRINWIDAPDDVFFVATEETRKLRRQLVPAEQRRAARSPCRKVHLPNKPKSAAVPSEPEPIVIED